MRLRLAIGFRLFVCAAVLAGSGCAQMFNTGTSELVLDNPAVNREFDAPAKTDFSRLKIDPLMLADLDAVGPESTVPATSQPTYDRLGIRKPLSQLQKSGPPAETTAGRPASIAESKPEPDAVASNIRKPILLRARQIEAKNPPQVEMQAAPAEQRAAPIMENNFVGSTSNLLSPQPASGGGDFVASTPRVESIPPPATTSEVARDSARTQQTETPPFANHPAIMAIQSEKCCPENQTVLQPPPVFDDLDFGTSEFEQIARVPRFVSPHQQAAESDCLCLRSSPDEASQDVLIQSNDEGFLEKLIAASTGLESIELASNENEISLLPAEPAGPAEAKRAASQPPAPGLNWRGQLGATIDVFQNEIEQTDDDALAEQLESGLAILQALEKNFAASLDGEDQSSDRIRQYWAHQIQAINELLKTPGEGDRISRSATRALMHLQDAVHELAALADLDLPFAVFCSKVTGYGQYQPFAATEFRPDQDVLVYCEIENFAPLLETRDGITNYQTRLSSSFWITDGADRIVQQQDFPAVTDDARNLRRDFFMHLPVTLADLAPGEYRLHVKVRDHGSGNAATLRQPLKFSVH